MKKTITGLLALGLLCSPTFAQTTPKGAGEGTTTVIIDGRAHVYDSNVSGAGPDAERLQQYKARNGATPVTDDQLNAKYGMGGTASGAATYSGTAIGQAWNKGAAPTSTAGMTQATQEIAAKYYGSDANKTPLEKGSLSPSSGSMQSYTQGLLGAAGVEGTAGPINRNSGAGAATFKSAQETTVACGTDRNFTANSWTGKLTCNGTASVTVRICPHPPGTVFCSDDELKSYLIGDGSQVQEASLGLTMAARFANEKSVVLKFTTKMTAAAVTQPVAKRASDNAAGGSATGTGTANGSSTAGMLSRVTNSTNYAKALEGPGAAVATCQERAERGESCDGDVVDLGWVKQDGSLPPGCDKDICLDQTTVKTDWVESCTRSFTRTNYACSFVRAPLACTTIAKTAPVTYTCEFANCDKVTPAEVEDYFGGVSNCVHEPAKDSCYTFGLSKRCDQRWTCAAGTVARTCDGGVDPKNEKGYILIGTTNKKVSVNGGTQDQFIESWLGPEVATNNCSAAPYPLAGTVSASCENGGVGKVRSSCEAWFGRTMTTDACTMTTTAGLTADVDESMKKGCGYCVRYSMLDSCSALAPVSDSDCPAARKSDCVLAGTRCSSASPQGSNPQCYAQEESYQCSKSATSCTTWGKPDNCKAPTEGITAGVPATPRQLPGSSGLNQAIIGLALMDAAAKSVNNCAGGQPGCMTPSAPSPGLKASDKRDTELEAEVEKQDREWYEPIGGLPRIFNGVQNECVRTTLGVNSANCCDLNLDRNSTQCTASEVQLALARRNKFTRYVGEYCKESRNGTCVSVAETYCAFEGLLPRIVQEQGRLQIDEAQAAYKGADTTAFSSTLSYYGGTDKGNWGWHQAKEGLHVYQWAWPTWCKDPASAQDKLKQDVTAPDCPPTPEVWFAACVESTKPGAPSRCDTPPATPFQMKPGFTVVRVDPLVETVAPIHQQAWVKGACDSASATCAYQVNLTTAGNRVVVSRETSFMSTTGARADTGTASFEMGPLAVVGKTIVRPVMWVMEGAGPSEVTVQYSTDEGTTWSAVKVPAVNPSGKATRIPGAEGVDLVVDCNAAAGGSAPMPCVLKASGTIVMTSKPWSVGKGQADCSGFTPGQFSVLDYDRMDFKDWLDSNPLAVADTSQLPNLLGQQVKSMTDSYYASGNSSITLGTATSVSPERAQSMVVSPDSGFGPFTVQLTVSGNWPQLYDDPAKNTNPVKAVWIDWGDGRATTPTEGVPQFSNGKAVNFTAQHEYIKPVDQKNMVHQIKVTIVAADGEHELIKAVQNNWGTVSNQVTPLGTTHVPGQTVNNSANQAAPALPGADVLKSLTR